MANVEQDRYNRLLKEFLITLTSNQKILKALSCDESEIDFELMEDVDIEEVMGKRIFHYKFVPVLSEKSATYLCVSIGAVTSKTSDRNGKKSDDIAYLEIHCDVMVSNTIATLNGGNRSLFITNEIVKTLQGGEFKNNIGTLQHLTTEQIMTMSDFHGYFSVFQVFDFIDSYNKKEGKTSRGWD